jgi:hypothetical protein
MKTRKSSFILFLGMWLVATIAVLFPAPAQAQNCGVPGLPACPPKKQRATRVPPAATATQTPTSTPTLPPAVIPLSGGGDPLDPAANLPAGPNPAGRLDNFPAPVVLSGLGIILLVVIIAILSRKVMVGSAPSAPSQIHEFGDQGWSGDGDKTGQGELKGNDEVVGLGQNDGFVRQSAGTTEHELGHSLADGGSSSSSVPQPPDEASDGYVRRSATTTEHELGHTLADGGSSSSSSAPKPPDDG